MREYSEQVITYSSPSLLQPLGSNTTTSGLGQDIPFLRLETRRHSSDENLVRAQSAEEAEDKNEIATSNEAHLQSLPTLPDEGILNPSSGRISAISKVAN